MPTTASALTLASACSRQRPLLRQPCLEPLSRSHHQIQSCLHQSTKCLHRQRQRVLQQLPCLRSLHTSWHEDMVRHIHTFGCIAEQLLLIEDECDAVHVSLVQLDHLEYVTTGRLMAFSVSLPTQLLETSNSLSSRPPRLRIRY